MQLTPEHRPTGKTRHYVGDQLAPTPSFLQIAQFIGDEGFYLLYLDERGDEITDTYHENLDRAFHQAEFEFTVPRDDWKQFLN